MSEEDGVALDVPVDHTLSVQDRQCLQDGKTHGGNLLLVHPEEEQTNKDMSFILFTAATVYVLHTPKSNSDCIRFTLT